MKNLYNFKALNEPERKGDKLYQPTTHNENRKNLPARVVERKIGRSTFIVSSRFNDGKQKDIVSTIARLVQYDNEKTG